MNYFHFLPIKNEVAAAHRKRANKSSVIAGILEARIFICPKMRWGEEDESLDDIQGEEVEDKELITIVRANPFLYNKSEKLYSNNEMKRLAWTTIGNSLSKKKTGMCKIYLH